MDEFNVCNLDYFPENILIDVLSYLTVRELVRVTRVCKRWKRLVRDQRLWRFVDLTAWKGVSMFLQAMRLFLCFISVFSYTSV
uniref:F-box domain-containing protein n=1 Tax=Monopterus albus TaxID=43700 RepID=A0A3Q3R4X1_MONAL